MSNTQLEELQALLPKNPELTQAFKKRYKETKIISVSDQINALQWFLRAWMAQRVLLLVLTGVIGYALYYYFSHRSTESRHIFSTLSTVNKTILLLPCLISEEYDDSSEMTSEETSAPPSHESSESLPPSPPPPQFDEPLQGKPIQSLIDYPPQRLFDALEKTSATSLDLRWGEDKKLIDESVDYWRRHTPPSQISQLLQEITQPMKKIYRLLVLRYHHDKAQNALTDQEKAVFQLMTDYILGIGERLNTKTKKAGLANPSQGNTWADIMRDFVNLRKVSKQQFATIAKLRHETQEMAEEVTILAQETAELRKQSDHQNQHLDAISQENERQKQQLADISQTNERQKQQLASIGKDFAKIRQNQAHISQENEHQKQQLADISQTNERQKQQLAAIGQSFAQARQDLANIEKQIEKNKEMDKKYYKYHTEKLVYWQQKLLENEQSLVAVRNICFHAASLNPNHPLIDTYYPRYLERKNADTSLTPIGQIIMYVIGLEYFIRISEPEQAQGMFDSINNFEGKAQLEGYQFLFKRAQQKIKSLETQLEEERNTVTPM